MSGQQRLQSVAASAQHAEGTLDPAPRRFQVGDQLPALCDVHDVAHVFGCSVPTIYGWDKAGKLRRFELRRPLGSKRWSGKRLQEYADLVVAESAAEPRRTRRPRGLRAVEKAS